MRNATVFSVFLILAGSAVAAQDSIPIELGNVPWLRNYDEALALARKTKKPLLVLFQEVPGCQTCRDFGCGPLRHPLIINVAREFVPVAVFNNIKGKDRDVLRRFTEPAGNNPVVRFLDADERDLLPRKEGIWDAESILKRMCLALRQAERDVPEYLKLLTAELKPSIREKAVFAMGCYWEGEKRLGALDGVLATRIGMLHKREVVEVEFDVVALEFKDLVKKARELDCLSRVYTRTDAQQNTAHALVGKLAERTDEEIDARTTQKYHLSNSPAYAWLPLTPIQATRINAALANGESPDRFLFPFQKTYKAKLDDYRSRVPFLLKDVTPARTLDAFPNHYDILRKKFGD